VAAGGQTAPQPTATPVLPSTTMRLSQLRQRLRDLGAAPCHEGRVLRA